MYFNCSALCEAQKFLRDQNPAKKPHLRMYRPPRVPSLPGAPGGFWRERLEEALLLAASEDAGAPGPEPAARLASWAGLAAGGERAPEAIIIIIFMIYDL
jgi:hypothetical protein